MATDEELRERWETDDGKERLAKVIEAAKKREDWAPLPEVVRGQSRCCSSANLPAAALFRSISPAQAAQPAYNTH